MAKQELSADTGKDARPRDARGDTVKDERPANEAFTPTNPRDSSWQDLIGLQRRWLLRDKSKNGALKPPATLPLKAESLGTPLLIYRYTRGQWIVTNEMGYGERIVDKLAYPIEKGKGGNGARLECRDRKSQRTATGRQVLGRDFESQTAVEPKVVGPSRPEVSAPRAPRRDSRPSGPRSAAPEKNSRPTLPAGPGRPRS
jgi:hypothetical protein